MYIVLYRSQDEASASEFCDSNYLSLSSLKMAGEARVSGRGSYIHPSRLTRDSVISWSERSYLIRDGCCFFTGPTETAAH